jgi:hypothetical protein
MKIYLVALDINPINYKKRNLNYKDIFNLLAQGNDIGPKKIVNSELKFTHLQSSCTLIVLGCVCHIIQHSHC